MLPLVTAGTVSGLVEILDVEYRGFTPEEISCCRMLVDQAGLALGASYLAAERDRQHLATVAALAAALEAKDAYTGNHAHAIADMAVAVGEVLGVAGRELKAIQMGALLHDVGKIGIPEAILNKPGPLTDAEFDVMKRHTVIGADIIASIPGMDEVVALVRSSHERWDGRGYPDGLGGHAGAAWGICDRRVRRLPRDDRGSRLPQGDVGGARLGRAAPLLGRPVHARRG